MPRKVDWTDPKQAKHVLKHARNIGPTNKRENWRAGDLVGDARLAVALARSADWGTRVLVARARHAAKNGVT